MFETMSSFLWAFFISFGLIILGILFEERLVKFERWLFTGLRRFVRSMKNG